MNTVIRRTSGLASGQKGPPSLSTTVPTPQILTILAQKGVPPPFRAGRKCVGPAEHDREIRAGGHEIGNHTWSHPDLTRLNAEAIKKELSEPRTYSEVVRFSVPLTAATTQRLPLWPGSWACAWRWMWTRATGRAGQDAILRTFHAEIKPEGHNPHARRKMVIRSATVAHSHRSTGS